MPKFWLSLVLAMVNAGSLNAHSLNGFELSGALVPPGDILPGGPPRDGIHSLDHPSFIPAGSADYLEDQDKVLGVEMGKEARAYPVRILVWHELVNDIVGGVPLAITYCPLCGSFAVFQRRIGGRTLEFGVSGLLYQSDVLLYDRQTESLWSQLLGKAVTGPMKGTSLEIHPYELTSWSDWRKRHPRTAVLDSNTGYIMDYSAQPYGSYESDPEVRFPVDHFPPPKVLHPKARVLGVEFGGQYRAYALEDLKKSGLSFQDKLGGVAYKVNYDPLAGRVWISDDKGNILPSTIAFWFAWFDFHPETDLYKPGKAAKNAH